MTRLGEQLSEARALVAEGRIAAALERAGLALDGGAYDDDRALVELRHLRSFLELRVGGRERLRPLADAAVLQAERRGGVVLGHALVDLAFACTANGEYADALRALDRAAPDEPELALLLALERWSLAGRLGDTKGEDAALGAAIRAVPDPDDHFELCLVRSQDAAVRGDAGGCLAFAERAAALAQGRLDRIRAGYRRCAALLGAGRPQDALELAQGVLDEECPHLDAPIDYERDLWEKRSAAEWSLGRIEDALTSNREVIARSRPQTLGLWAAWLNAAQMEVSLGRYEDARRSAPPMQTRGRFTLLEVKRRLLEVVLAAHDRDAERFDELFQPFVGGGGTHDACHPAYAELAARAADLAEKAGSGWIARAVRLRRLALHQLVALERTAEVAAQERALRRLLDRGAPIPLGPFLLQRRLGRGAFGEVWEAEHPSGVRAAVKVLRASGQGADALRNELRAVARLDHPGVVRLLHAGVVERAAAVMERLLVVGSPWIATEVCDGGSLSASARRSWADVRRVLLAVLDALAHAHARGLLHLDLKPGNVLLAADGAPRLADFGLAAAMAEVSAIENVSGTPSAMAPEQFRAAGREYGPWTDLYAFGCLATELVSGRAPFRASTLEGLRHEHLTEVPLLEPRIAVPAAFVPFVRRLLAKDPADRFRSAADAARVLASLGPPVGEDAGGELEPEDDFAATLVLPLADLPPPAPIAASSEVIELPPPRIPARWDRGEAAQAPIALFDAGMGLFPLRRPPLVGRRDERTALWEHLRATGATGRGRQVTVGGPRGAGATALLSWLGERALEVGAATVLELYPWAEPGEGVRRMLLRHLRAGGLATEELGAWVERMSRGEGVSAALALRCLAGADPDGLAELIGQMASRRPVLVLAHDVDPTDELEALAGSALVVVSARQGAIGLGPLPADEHRALLASRLPLAPGLLGRLAEATASSPRLAVGVLADLVEREALVPGEGAYRLRNEGTRIAETLPELWRDVVSRLPQVLRPVLRVGADLGRRIDEGAWRAACAQAGLPEPTEARERLLSSGLAERDGERLVLAGDDLRDALGA